MLTKEQTQSIINHLRSPENELRISEIAKTIAVECNNAGYSISPEKIQETALLMNIGETDERISYIYNPSYNWKEHPEAVELNKLHGQYSVEMADSLGITLSDEQRSAIISHSEGKYSSTIAQIIKIAEICSATEKPRYYRGEKKQPAENWPDVSAILEKEGVLDPAIIALAGNSYGRKFTRKNWEKTK